MNLWTKNPKKIDVQNVPSNRYPNAAIAFSVSLFCRCWTVLLGWSKLESGSFCGEGNCSVTSGMVNIEHFLWEQNFDLGTYLFVEDFDSEVNDTLRSTSFGKNPYRVLLLVFVYDFFLQKQDAKAIYWSYLRYARAALTIQSVVRGHLARKRTGKFLCTNF